jgi:hypothetical protein
MSKQCERLIRAAAISLPFFRQKELKKGAV